jgi:hypothetical protein
MNPHELVNLAEVFVLYLEQDLEVFHDTTLIVGLWDDGDSTTDSMAQDDLCWRFRILLRECHDLYN